MQTEFGLAHVWAQGDVITKTVALILLLMSLASWLVILLKSWDLIQYKRQARTAESFWHSEDFSAGLAKLPQTGNLFRQLALEAREASAHHQNAKAQEHLHDSLDISDWITRCLRNAIDDCTARLQGGLAVLASVGSTAPFVGLFGTVWGIYHALIGIGKSGQASIDQVAGPVGEALIMTALGLAVAIPAVLGYNALLRGNKTVLHKLNSFAHDLHAYFVTGARLKNQNPNTNQPQNIDQNNMQSNYKNINNDSKQSNQHKGLSDQSSENQLQQNPHQNIETRIEKTVGNNIVTMKKGG